MTTKKKKLILIPCLSVGSLLPIIISVCINTKKPHICLDPEKYVTYFSADWKDNEPTIFSLTNLYLSKPLTESQKVYACLKVISIDGGFSNFKYDSSQPCDYIGGDKYEINIPNLSVVSTKIPEWKDHASILTLEANFKCVSIENKIVWEDTVSKIYIGRNNN